MCDMCCSPEMPGPCSHGENATSGFSNAGHVNEPHRPIYSGWTEAVPIPDKQSETIEHAFHNRSVAAHGCTETAISDNGLSSQSDICLLIWRRCELSTLDALHSVPNQTEK